MLVSAHIGHWALGMLELIPALVVLVVTVWKWRRARPLSAREP